jgi:hypothetical protein
MSPTTSELTFTRRPSFTEVPYAFQRIDRRLGIVRDAIRVLQEEEAFLVARTRRRTEPQTLELQLRVLEGAMDSLDPHHWRTETAWGLLKKSWDRKMVEYTATRTVEVTRQVEEIRYDAIRRDEEATRKSEESTEFRAQAWERAQADYRRRQAQAEHDREKLPGLEGLRAKAARLHRDMLDEWKPFGRGQVTEQYFRVLAEIATLEESTPCS